MELDLNELAATLTIGAFFIFGIEYILRNSFDKSVVRELLKNFNPETSKYIVGAVLLTASFIFGLVIEDVSNLLVDNILVSDKNNWRIAKLILPESESQIRKNTFLDEKYKPTFYNQALEKNLVNNINSKNESEEINGFYFSAKNKVYRQGNYYDELKRIQMRIDFSRALFTIAAFLLLITIVLGISKLIVFGFARRYKKKMKSNCKMSYPLIILCLLHYKIFARPYLRIRRFLLTFVILAFIYSLSVFAYHSEEKEFNKRVYGYYLSLINCEQKNKCKN